MSVGCRFDRNDTVNVSKWQCVHCGDVNSKKVGNFVILDVCLLFEE